MRRTRPQSLPKFARGSLTQRQSITSVNTLIDWVGERTASHALGLRYWRKLARMTILYAGQTVMAASRGFDRDREPQVVSALSER